jgi:hypothetical protein
MFVIICAAIVTSLSSPLQKPQTPPDPLDLIYRVELRKTVTIKDSNTNKQRQVTRVKCGTGFRVRNVQGIVTCLHVAALSYDGWSLTVVGQGAARQPKTDQKIKIVRADKAYDLAIISSDEINKWPDNEGFLPGLTDGKPAPIRTFGCPEGIDALEIAGSIVGTKLALGMVPQGNRLSLSFRASPDLNKAFLQIKAKEGAWSRGSSGSPVISEGKLVGVVDGGLSVGSIGWAVPYSSAAFKDSLDSLKGLAKDDTQNLFTTAEYEVDAEEEAAINDIVATIARLFAVSENKFEKVKGKEYDRSDYWVRYVSKEKVFDYPDTLLSYGKGGECYVSGIKNITGADPEDARYKLERFVELIKVAVQKYCNEQPGELKWNLSYDEKYPGKSQFRQIIFDGNGRTIKIDAIQDDQKRCYVYLGVGVK